MFEHYKRPRLYVEMLPEGAVCDLSQGQRHYLKNVLRMRTGDQIRVFNAQRGEFLATLDAQYHAILDENLRAPLGTSRRVHLYAPPLQKDRLDFMIEKATELGMTDFHPLITERTTIRAVNETRLCAQVIEAAEQCERLDVPTIHAPIKLEAALAEAAGNVFAGVERLAISSTSSQRKLGSSDDVVLDSCLRRNGVDRRDVSILIGPPGGWTDGEKEKLMAITIPLSLGENTLRTETAVLASLILIG